LVGGRRVHSGSVESWGAEITREWLDARGKFERGSDAAGERRVDLKKKINFRGIRT
jgi:hypothetical protein